MDCKYPESSPEGIRTPSSGPVVIIPHFCNPLISFVVSGLSYRQIRKLIKALLDEFKSNVERRVLHTESNVPESNGIGEFEVEFYICTVNLDQVPIINPNNLSEELERHNIVQSEGVIMENGRSRIVKTFCIVKISLSDTSVIIRDNTDGLDTILDEAFASIA